MKLEHTTNYSLFTSNKLQRQFSAIQAEKIAYKMKKNGFPASFAISVFKKDGKLHLNNGHHRLWAAKSLGLPVWYIVEHEWAASELVDEGVTGKNWPIKDASIAYAKKGQKDYVILLDYAKRGIPIRYAASMLRGEHAASGNACDFVSAGTFKVKTTSHIEAVCSVVESVKAAQKEATSQVFISSVSALIIVEGFSADQLVKKILSFPGKIEKTKTRDQMLDQLEEIYNYHCRIKDNISFKAKNKLMERRQSFGK